MISVYTRAPRNDQARTRQSHFTAFEKSRRSYNTVRNPRIDTLKMIGIRISNRSRCQQSVFTTFGEVTRDVCGGNAAKHERVPGVRDLEAEPERTTTVYCGLRCTTTVDWTAKPVSAGWDNA